MKVPFLNSIKRAFGMMAGLISSSIMFVAKTIARFFYALGSAIRAGGGILKKLFFTLGQLIYSGVIKVALVLRAIILLPTKLLVLAQYPVAIIKAIGNGVWSVFTTLGRFAAQSVGFIASGVKVVGALFGRGILGFFVGIKASLLFVVNGLARGVFGIIHGIKSVGNLFARGIFGIFAGIKGALLFVVRDIVGSVLGIGRGIKAVGNLFARGISGVFAGIKGALLFVARGIVGSVLGIGRGIKAVGNLFARGIFGIFAGIKGALLFVVLGVVGSVLGIGRGIKAVGNLFARGIFGIFAGIKGALLFVVRGIVGSVLGIGRGIKAVGNLFAHGIFGIFAGVKGALLFIVKGILGSVLGIGAGIKAVAMFFVQGFANVGYAISIGLKMVVNFAIEAILLPVRAVSFIIGFTFKGMKLIGNGIKFAGAFSAQRSAVVARRVVGSVGAVGPRVNQAVRWTCSTRPRVTGLFLFFGLISFLVVVVNKNGFLHNQYLHFSDLLVSNEQVFDDVELNNVLGKRLVKIEKGLELLREMGKESGEQAHEQSRQLSHVLERMVLSAHDEIRNSKVAMNKELQYSLDKLERNIRGTRNDIKDELSDKLIGIEKRLETLNNADLQIELGDKIQNGLTQLEKQLKNDIAKKITLIEAKLNTLPGVEREKILQEKVSDLINTRLASAETLIEERVQSGLANVEKKLTSIEDLRSDVKASEEVRRLFDEEVLGNIDVKLDEERKNIKGELEQKLGMIEDRISCLFDVAVQQEQDAQVAGQQAGESIAALVDERLTATEQRIQQQMEAKLQAIDEKLHSFDDKLSQGANSLEQLKWVQEEQKARESIDTQIRAEVQGQLKKMKATRDPRMLRLKALATQSKKKRLIRQLLEEDELDEDL